VTKNVFDRTQTLKLRIARKRKYYGEQLLVEEGLLDMPEMKDRKRPREVKSESLA
jgi:hypothetical protein